MFDINKIEPNCNNNDEMIDRSCLIKTNMSTGQHNVNSHTIRFFAIAIDTQTI